MEAVGGQMSRQLRADAASAVVGAGNGPRLQQIVACVCSLKNYWHLKSEFGEKFNLIGH